MRRPSGTSACYLAPLPSPRGCTPRAPRLGGLGGAPWLVLAFLAVLGLVAAGPFAQAALPAGMTGPFHPFSPARSVLALAPQALTARPASNNSTTLPGDGTAYGITCAPIVLWSGAELGCVTVLDLTEVLLMVVSLLVITYVFRGSDRSELPGDSAEIPPEDVGPGPDPGTEPGSKAEELEVRSGSGATFATDDEPKERA